MVKKTDAKKETKAETKKNDAKAEKVNTKKEKKENLFKQIVRYFNGVSKETKRIRWTNGRDLVKYSIASVMFVIFFGIYFYAIDWLALLIRSIAK